MQAERVQTECVMLGMDAKHTMSMVKHERQATNDP